MSNRQIFMGLILIIVGVVLLGRTLDFFIFSFGDFLSFLFPVFLIAIGIWLLARRRGQEQAAEVESRIKSSPSHVPPEPPRFQSAATQSEPRIKSTPPPPGGSDKRARPSQTPECHAPGKLRYSRFIGDMYVDCSGIELQNVEIGNFLGDVEVKLHGGNLAPGLNRMIISGFIGDVRVLVPQGMAVFAQSSNFIGDIEMMGKRSSGFGNSLDAQTANYAEAESKLYIASNHFIGDVQVYVI